MAGLAAVFAGCVRVETTPTPTEPAPSRPAPRVLWVDAFAPLGGDGTSDRPLRALPQALLPNDRLELRSGLYRGPLSLPSGCVLTGHGEAVIFVEGAGTVVTSVGATLRDLSIQGGGVGVEAREGQTLLQNVHFSGHRTDAISVGPDAGVTVERARFEGTVSESTGIAVHGGSLHCADTRFTGAYKTAIRAEAQATLELANLSVEGPRTALHLIDSRTRGHHVTVGGGTGPAFFAARGTLELSDCATQGHEYAVQTGIGTTLRLTGLVAKRAQRTSLALVQTTATIDRLTIEGGGSNGAVECLGGDVSLDHVTLTAVQSVGVLVRQGHARIGTLVVDRVSAERESDGSRSLGDALHVREATVTVEQLTATDAEGNALFATANATVTVQSLVSERAAFGAVVVERGAQVHLRTLQSSGSKSSAITVPDRAELAVERAVLRGGSLLPIAADCRAGAEVHVGQLVTSVPVSLPDCVHRDTPAAP